MSHCFFLSFCGEFFSFCSLRVWRVLMMADNRSGISCTSAIIYIQMVLLKCIETCSFFNDLLHIITHCCVCIRVLFARMRASHLSMAQHLNSVITLWCVFFLRAKLKDLKSVVYVSAHPTYSIHTHTHSHTYTMLMS